MHDAVYGRDADAKGVGQLRLAHLPHFMPGSNYFDVIIGKWAAAIVLAEISTIGRTAFRPHIVEIIFLGSSK